MRLIPAVALALSSISCFHVHLSAGEPKHQLHYESVDPRKALETFPFAVAIFDMDNDGDLDCLSAVQTDYDSSVPRTTFVWILPGVNGREPRNITYDVVPGASPEEFRFWDRDGDGTVETGRYVYTNYKNCGILYLYERKECMLWVTPDVRDSVPPKCMDYYEDNCDVAHMSYDSDTCSPFFNF